MRFIPATHMGSGTVCVESTANGGVSGSFVSGSETYNFHEFTSSTNNSTDTFQFEITSGFTQRARVIVIGGGGAGGETGTGGTYHGGGGGGGGQVLDVKNVNLFPNQTYQIQVGKGGDAAVPLDPVPPNPTYNGGDGDSSRFRFGDLDIIAQGGEGGYGEGLQIGDGGDSGAGFTGGNGNSNDGGGGAGNTANGSNPPSSNHAGDGGAGTTLVLGYTSPTFGASTVGVGGGGGGATKFGISLDRGIGVDGGGDGAYDSDQSEDGTRHTGGGGGGGESVSRPSPPPYGEGSEGGDGIVIVMYPTGSC